MTLNWMVDNWDQFSIWVTNQPLFVEVAFGIGLFYVVLHIVKAIYQLLAFLYSGLFASPGRFKKKRKQKPVKSPGTKPVTIDDDAPPFVFR